MSSEGPSPEVVLRSSRLFGSLGGELVSSLAKQAVRKDVGRGDFLWRAGDEACSFVVIASGLVKIVRASAGPSPCMLALFGPRESAGDMAVVSRGRYPADAVAATDRVTAVCIPADVVLGSMERTPALAMAINRSLVEHSRALQSKIAVMAAGPVERRLAAMLEHLVERFGDELDDGTHHLPVALSRAELAALIGATVETTIRAMSRWQREGVVDTTPSGFVIRDLHRLRAA